jgi:phosphohistidine phosphatase
MVEEQREVRMAARRRLVLLRHAKSDWPAGTADHDRPLAARGRHDAPRMGEEIARRGLRPQAVLVSTAARTKATWGLVSPFLGSVEPRYEPAVYDASSETLLRLVRDFDDETGTVMLLGHNPGLELLAATLIGGGPDRLRDRLGEKFPTCALAVIDFDEDSWADIRPGAGRLALFLTPGDIE